MKILIPPSEGKKPGGNCTPIINVSDKIKAKLKNIPEELDKAEKYFGVKGETLLKAIEANNTLETSPTLPAIERYKGVVYKGISYDTLNEKGKIFFDENVLIISGLFGAIEPQTHIPNYKYKMQKEEKIWIEEECIDLLPQLHRSSVRYNKGITVEFIILKDNKKMPAGHAGKLIKGKFIRWLCENQITSENKFKEFSEDEFRFDGKCFIKKINPK